MKIIIAAHKFNPAHLSHIIALTEIFKSNGIDVYHRVSAEYVNLEPNTGLIYIPFKELLGLQPEDIYINYAPSLAALIESFLVKFITKSKLIYFLHEPFSGVMSYLRSGFSILKTIKISLISLVTYLNCNLSQIVILSSSKAYNLKIRNCNEISRYKKINLLFRDELNFFNSKFDRNYISYIGTIAEDHAFEEFVSLVHEGLISRRMTKNKFLIATKSEIPKYLEEKIEVCKKSGLLDVISGFPMTNYEINSYYYRSFAVWNAYKRSMQSGVLPKSYMFGAPVISCEYNSSEYYINGVHGASVGIAYDAESFFAAIESIKSNFQIMSKNCRNYYLNNFDISSQSAIVLEIMGLNNERKNFG